MYSTCLFCHSALGDNQVIEHFPVGKRLAFDEAKGRLWVVCTRCRQWNLSPLEERWEAIEEAERLFRATRLRVSTDQIGLARAPDGTELIRIGAPQRPEMAAWRYGPRFEARWRVQGRTLAAVAGAGSVLKTGLGGAVLFGAAGAAAMVSSMWVPLIAEQVKRRRLVTQFTGDNGQLLRFTRAHLQTIFVAADPTAPEGWHLRVKHAPPDDEGHTFRESHPVIFLTGDAARRVGRELMPQVNRGGGNRGTVEDSVQLLSAEGAFDPLMRRVAREIEEWRRPMVRYLLLFKSPDQRSRRGLHALRPAVRLALEMALHEEEERAALSGELTELQKRWQEAEEIAAISDSLTLPPAVLRQFERFRLR